MIAILTIFGAAGVAFTAHLVYGAVLAGREFDRSEQAWSNAADRLVPRRIAPSRNAGIPAAQLQRV